MSAGVAKLSTSEPAWSRRRLLTSRDFAAYAAGQTLSGFGSSLSPLALAFAVLSLTRSATMLGVVLLSSRLPVIAFTLLGGVLGDRLPRRLVMLGTDAGRAVVQATTAVLLVSGHAAIWSLAALQASAGLGTALFAPASGGLIATLAPQGHLREANALLALLRNVSSIGAVAVAGAIVATLGSGSAFAVDAATFVVSAVSLALIRPQRLAQRPPRGRTLLADLGEGWHAVRERSWILTYAVHVAVLNAFVLSPFFVLGPIVATRHLGGAPGWATMAVGYGVGALAGNALVLRWRPRRPLVAVFTSSAALVPLFALLAAPAALWLLTIAAVAAGAQSALYNTVASATVQSNVPDGVLARVTAFTTVGGLAGVPVGMALTGVAAATVGTARVLEGAAVVAFVAALLALIPPGVRSLRSDAAPVH